MRSSSILYVSGKSERSGSVSPILERFVARDALGRVPFTTVTRLLRRLDAEKLSRGIYRSPGALSPVRAVDALFRAHASEALRAFRRAGRETLTIQKLTRHHPVMGHPSIY